MTSNASGKVEEGSLPCRSCKLCCIFMAILWCTSSMPPRSWDSIFNALAKSDESGSETESSIFKTLLNASPPAPPRVPDSIFRAFTSANAPASSGLSEAILKALTAKPKVFVSYHHAGDRWYYNEFTRFFADTYDICSDNSVNREVDSDDCDYVIRAIRESYLTGTSCTVVLCGAETPWRKFVDWEIKATLDKQHGLIGVNLPTNPRDLFGNVQVPSRLLDNIQSGFAVWIDWSELAVGGPTKLRASLQVARLSSNNRIVNSRALRRRNG